MKKKQVCLLLVTAFSVSATASAADQYNCHLDVSTKTNLPYSKSQSDSIDGIKLKAGEKPQTFPLKNSTQKALVSIEAVTVSDQEPKEVIQKWKELWDVRVYLGRNSIEKTSGTITRGQKIFQIESNLENSMVHLWCEKL